MTYMVVMSGSYVCYLYMYIRIKSLCEIQLSKIVGEKSFSISHYV